MQSFATWDAEGGVPRNPFRLRPGAADDPSIFLIEIVVNDSRYAYGFSVDDDHVLEEWLHSYPEKRRRILFERKGSAIKFGTTVSRDIRSRLELLEEMNRPNSLFLSLCAQVRINEWMPVYRWFRSQLRMRLNATVVSRRIADQVARLAARGPDSFDKLVALLAAADVGITSLSIDDSEETSDSEANVLNQLDGARDRLNRVMWRTETRPELKFLHGNSSEEFTLQDESAGTRSWIALLPMVLEALEDGFVVAVDEIDTSLHPLLTAELVKLFNNPEVNKSGAQLIFTTHDSSLLGKMMGSEVLPRDSIWFVEKNNDGATGLLPLTDFKPRAGQNNERRYLGGSYGAVPVLDTEEFVNTVLGR